MTFRRTLTGASVIALTTAHPLAAQDLDPRMGLAEFFAPDRIATAFAHLAISAIRTQMELRYEHLSADPLRGVVSISGVVARPVLPYDQANACEVTVERVTITSDFAQPFRTDAEVNLNVIGAQAELACVERDVALALRTAGFKNIPLDQFKIRASYAYTTGETALDTTIAVNGLATLDLSGSGTILPRIDSFGYPGDPAVRVSRAVATLQDDGGWTALSQILPPNLRDPATVRALAQESVSDLLTEGGVVALGAVERQFIDQLMNQVEAYVADPGQITIEADLPEDGITLEPEMYADPAALIAALNLQARAVPSARSDLLSPADLAAIRDPEDLSDSERLRLAEALLAGRGVPRSTSLVPDLLGPLLDDPNAAGPAAMLLAEAIAETNVRTAYDFALAAAGSGMAGAVALLDRLEARMSTDAVMTVQDAYYASRPDPLEAIIGDDPRDLRALALAHYTGDGAARSYARAYYYALLAGAAGDIAANSLLDEINARFAARGPDVAAAWAGLTAEIEAQALADWIDADLATRFAP